MSLSRLTLCLLTAEAGAGVAGCLAGAREAVDEMLVGHSGSPEAAAAIAAQCRVRCLYTPTADGFAAARNALLDAAGGDWVLFLDDDERLELNGADRLRNLAAGGEGAGYLLPVYSETGSGEEGDTFLSYQVRLFRNRPGNRYAGVLGEHLPEALLSAAAEAPVPEGVVIRHGGLAPGEAERRSARNLAVLEGGPACDLREPGLALARGLNLLRQGRLEDACAQFGAADSPVGLTAAHLTRWLGHCLLLLGREGEALDRLEEGCRADPAYTDLWLLRGQALAGAGRPAEAEAALRRCLDLGPAPPPYESVVGAGDALPLLLLGEMAERAGHLAAALDSYSQAYQARPARTEPLYRSAGVLGLLGRSGEIAKHLKGLVRPADSEQWLVLADILSLHRQYRPALRCIDAAARLGSDPVETALIRGFCLLRAGEPAAAGEVLATIPPEHGLWGRILQMRLIAAWSAYACPEARALLAELERSGLPAGAHRAARGLHHLLCRTDTALEPGPAWEAAGGELLLQAVDGLLACGRRQDAERAAELMERTGWPEGYRSVALLFRLRRQHRLAKRYYDRAFAAGLRDPDLLCGLAELELKGRNWPRALALAAEAAERAPTSPTPYLLRAQIFRAQAVELLRLATKRWDDPEAARLLAELTGAGASVR